MSPRTKNPTPPKKWLRDVPSDSRVVIEPGEADTLDGCVGIVARIGVRSSAIHNAIIAWRAYAATPDELEHLAGLEAEYVALQEARSLVTQRKNAIAQAIDVRFERSFRMAVKERYGSGVMQELSDRAREIQAEAQKRHGDRLVGAVVPVGAIGGMRRRT